MKTTSQCPKCNGKEIYTDTTKTKHTDSRFLPITKGSWHYVSVDVFICTACGYLEEYIIDKDLKDANKMEKLKKNWKKL